MLEKTCWPLFAPWRLLWLALAGCLLLGGGSALADTPLTLKQSWAGNINYVGTQKTLRTNPNGTNACSWVGAGATTSAAITGIPATATISAAYLYWAGSGSTPDYTVTFEGASITAPASRQYASTSVGYNFFSGAADVTAAVVAKRNGTYNFTGLTIDNTNNTQNYCAVEAVLGGWALLVVYSDPAEAFRVINLYEGFQYYQNSSITLTLSNFRTPTPLGANTGKASHISWEGDPTLSGGGENLTFQGNALTDANNPAGNQFNSVSNIAAIAPSTGSVDNAAYGVDFDAYLLNSTQLSAGMTSASTVYSSGGDLVLLSAEVISVPNVPVADLGITMGFTGTMARGQTVTYSLDVTNNGPNTEAGPITVTNTPPAGLTYTGASGTGWVCNSPYTTCTRSGSLASGVAASTITLTATVAANATGTQTNTATVVGTQFDNVASNDTATDSQTVQTADLSLTMTRGAALVPGSNATYTLTASNAGPLTESSGAITVTDTLPAGLSFVSATGTNWTCSSAVVCTYNATLASGAAAPPITLTVAVAAGASGTITNSAVVAGGQYDSNAANNTASDSYSLGATMYAYYAMDDTSWASGIADSSGNGRTGTLLAGTTATPTGYNPGVPQPPNPPGSAIAGNPGTCGTGRFPAQAGPSGINTGADIGSAMGSNGTIAFWYASNAAWNDGNNRMLLDASNNLGNATADKHFYLVKETDGRLRFVVESSANDNSEAVSNSLSYAANTWHHIVATWNFGAGNRIRLYVDGVQVGSNTGLGGQTVGQWATLAVGGQRMTGVQGTGGSYGSNSANGYIDEVRIYNSELTTATTPSIATVMNYAHACAGVVDHYELSLPTAGVACVSSPVTVTACLDSSSPCTNPATSLSGQTAALAANAGTLATTTVAFNASGIASTTLSYPAAVDGATASVTLSGETTAASNPRKCCPNGAGCAAGNSCSTTFNTAGFIFSAASGGAVATIPSQVAGVSGGTYYLRAVKTGSTTQACEAALSGANTVNFAYECVDPGTCYAADLMSVNGGSATTIARNNSGSVSAFTSVNMTFDANGNAPLTFLYNDVGQVRLYASKAAGGSLLSALSGSSNAFVVKPYDFGVVPCAATVVGNCIAAPADPGLLGAGGIFAGAGELFKATVTARASGGAATPSFGAGSNSGTETVVLTRTRVAPTGVGVADGSLGGTTSLPRNSFSGGVATVTDLSWSEVGVITLTATNTTFLGNSLTTTGATGNVGRFAPEHFETVVTGPMSCTGLTFASACPAGGLVYSGQTFTTKVTAYALGGTGGTGVTTNYADSYARAVTLAAWDASGSTATQNPPAGGGALTGNSVAAASFAAGVATTLTPVYAFTATPTVPTNIFLRAADTDVVSSLRSPSSSSVEGGVKVVNGRMRLLDAYGSELLPIRVPVRVEYWSEEIAGRFKWQINTADSISLLNAGNVAIGNCQGGLVSQCTAAGGTPNAGTIAASLSAAMSGGQTTMILTRPGCPAGACSSGSFDLALNLGTAGDDQSCNGTHPGTTNASLPWLRFGWCGAGKDPSARIKFGSPKAPYIYLRERY